MPSFLWKNLWITHPSRVKTSGVPPPLTAVLLRWYHRKEGFTMKTTTNANIPNETRKAVYARDGYRCALCDDVRGLQLHHVVRRSAGGTDDPANLITLCWRCHAEAHGTWIAERHAPLPKSLDAGARWAIRQLLLDEYEQLCTEYVSDLYARRGVMADPVLGGGT